jgi:hypothetical protein
MHLRFLRRFFAGLAALLVLSELSFAAHAKPCLSTDEAAKMLNQDICISAHIYDVVQLSDGTRFLDVCTPETPDANCRFTIVSPWEDHEEVGELSKFHDMDVQVRGIVRPMHGRAGLLLSHARQFTGGPPRFKPNPKLIHGFSGEQERPPISDPNLRSQGGRRAFMSTRDRETLPAK